MALILTPKGLALSLNAVSDGAIVRLGTKEETVHPAIADVFNCFNTCCCKIIQFATHW